MTLTILGKCDRTEIECQFFELMYLANRYGTSEFRKLFVTVMREEVKVEDLCMVLDMAIICCSDDLRDYCLNQIKHNWSTAIRFNFFPNLMKETLERILRIDCIQRNEMVLFERCIEWARKTCKEKCIDDNKPANWRAVLGSCIDHINFLKMSADELSSLQDKGIFTRSEIDKFFHGMVNQRVEQNSNQCSPRFTSEEFCQWIYSLNSACE